MPNLEHVCRRWPKHDAVYLLKDQNREILFKIITQYPSAFFLSSIASWSLFPSLLRNDEEFSAAICRHSSMPVGYYSCTESEMLHLLRQLSIHYHKAKC